MDSKNSCPICDSNKITTFLKRENVPVFQNLLVRDERSASEIMRGDLHLTVCQECGFIFNQTFESSKLRYDANYDNTQDCSPSFDAYTSKLVNSLALEKNVQNCRIVEVGCGKGSFLRKLVQIDEWNNHGYGFDPSYVGPETELNGRLKFIKKYYDSNSTATDADVIICRHVIEHVPHPLQLLRSIKQTLLHSAHSRVFFETPDVEWILRNKVIWDFFYEHCSYFTKESLVTAFEIAGFQVIEVKKVFEDQYLWLEAVVSNNSSVVTKKPASIPLLANEFATAEYELKTKWENKIRELNTKGKVAVWGAGAKGVTFVNLIDPNRKLIDCVIDLNPNKQGKYIPGTGHKVVNYKEIQDRKIVNVILMNPNYYEENMSLLKKSQIDINLLK